MVLFIPPLDLGVRAKVLKCLGEIASNELAALWEIFPAATICPTSCYQATLCGWAVQPESYRVLVVDFYTQRKIKKVKLKVYIKKLKKISITPQPLTLFQISSLKKDFCYSSYISLNIRSNKPWNINKCNIYLVYVTYVTVQIIVILSQFLCSCTYN